MLMEDFPHRCLTRVAVDLSTGANARETFARRREEMRGSVKIALYGERPRKLKRGPREGQEVLVQERRLQRLPSQACCFDRVSLKHGNVGKVDERDVGSHR